LGYLKITPGVAGLGHRAAAFGPNPCLTRNDRSERVLKNAMSKLLLFLSPSIGRRRASVSGKSTRAGGPEREVENEMAKLIIHLLIALLYALLAIIEGIHS